MATNRIESLIREKGYNMTSFAEKLGVTRQNLYNILKNPSYPTLENIANHLEVPMWQLFASHDEVIEGKAKEEKDVFTCPHCHQVISDKDFFRK